MKNMLEKLFWERRKERYIILSQTKTIVVITILNTLKKTSNKKAFVFVKTLMFKLIQTPWVSLRLFLKGSMYL
jgi:hypothetical protein